MTGIKKTRAVVSCIASAGMGQTGIERIDNSEYEPEYIRKISPAELKSDSANCKIRNRKIMPIKYY
jgi:hypothetical protein